jgi:hypothetical protein
MMRMACFHRDVSRLRILDTVEGKNLCTLAHRASVHYEPWECRTENAMVIQETNHASWEFCRHLLHALLKRWAGPLEKLKSSHSFARGRTQLVIHNVNQWYRA